MNPVDLQPVPGPHPAPKAWAEGYDPAPFVFILESLHGRRLAAWAADPHLVLRAFHVCLDFLPADLEVFAKVLRDPSDPASPWLEHRGTASQDRIRAATAQHARLLLGDGALQFFVRDPAHDAHVSIDDHGILETTTVSPDLLPRLLELGFAERFEDLLNEYPHHHRSPLDAAARRQTFFDALGLSSTRPPKA